MIYIVIKERFTIILFLIIVFFYRIIEREILDSGRKKITVKLSTVSMRGNICLHCYNLYK